MKAKLIVSTVMFLVMAATALPIASADMTDGGAGQVAGMPDQAKMMEIKKLGSPNENHQVLNSLVGNWTHVVRWKMDPSAEFTESTGTNTNEWILGGRFLQQKVSGQFMGEAFEGIGLTGYDNVKKEYNTIWIDNMSTGMMTASGQYDAATGTIAESGSFSCPMTGKTDMKFRSEWKIIDNDHYSYSMYQVAEDGTEFKGMESTYTRQV